MHKLLLLLSALPCACYSTEILSIADGLVVQAECSMTPASFDITGKVCVCSHKSMTITDGKTGLEVLFDTHQPTKAVRRGDVVRSQGFRQIAPDGTPRFEGVVCEILHQGPLRRPVPVKGSEINDGSRLFTFVCTRGVITSVLPDEIDPRMTWLTLRTPASAVTVAARNEWRTFDDLHSLLDAEVEIEGFVKPATGWRRNIGPLLLPTDDDALSVVVPPPSDPFSAPLLTDSKPAHRQRTQGIVVAVTRKRFFLRTPRGRFISISPSSSAPMPHVGERITAVGFAELDPYHVRLVEALTRTDGHGHGPEETVCPITAEQLFTDGHGHNKVDTTLNGKIVRLCGTIDSPADILVKEGRLRLICGIRQVEVDFSGISDNLPSPPPHGSSVAISGLCLTEFENVSTVTTFPLFRRILIVPRGVDDLVVLARPSWWTPLRLTLLAIALGIVLIGSALWNVMLRRKSEKRGKELYEEKIDHALAEQKVEERTRLAVELHDSVSQTLTGVALQLDGGEVETAKTMLASCRGELRRCLWDLRSRTFEEKDMTEAVTRTITPHLNGVEATVRFNVPRERLSESLTHAILRIIRELVVNAIRHGQAQHVKIAGEMHASTVSFSVTDDGCGFDPETAPGPKQGHFGLLGIRERIEDFNGTVEVKSSPGQGAKFTVTLTAPDERGER